MKKTGICPKCGCKNVIADAMAADHSYAASVQDMEVRTFLNPKSFLYKGMRLTTVSAWVCSDCGYIEYYADDPANITLPEA